MITIYDDAVIRTFQFTRPDSFEVQSNYKNSLAHWRRALTEELIVSQIVSKFQTEVSVSSLQTLAATWI
jgi:hypothetical protein